MSLLHLGSASVKWVRLPKLIRLASVFILSVFGLAQLQFLGSVEKLKQPWTYNQRPYVDVDIRTRDEHIKDAARDILYIDDVEEEWTSNKKNVVTRILKPVYARLGPQNQKATNTQKGVGILHMQRWASENHTFEAEAQRFLEYISNPQIQCKNLLSPGVQAVDPRGRYKKDWAWKVCYDEQYVGSNITNEKKKCIVYSFGPVIYQGKIEVDLARNGCEVHVFDPSSKTPIQHSSSFDIHIHALTLDWRESLKISRPNRPSAKTRQSRRLASIMQELGHQQVDIIRADLQSSEWKLLENLILDGSINHVRQIIFTAHLHWSGFEVRGSDPEVVRYWYSVLKSLESTGFKLFSSFKDNNGPKVLLGKNFENASCCFTLGWVKINGR
ncbi:methyltransferase-like protein 24 [Anneissia japonica]|uniref:methyltransferase-like protein 24 n=1 Tax=Anneissia japonica TaxID=1529436 RepID=UPI0014258A66|nr:methyltransferase-like protein 24 [Anneissia japonica]